MALSDFATRMFGYNPFDTNSSGQPIQLPGATMANAASIAQPTLEQSYQDDLRQAQMDRVGNLGMLLLAAGQQLTPAQRATILSQAPQYMDGSQRDAMTAAQARLYGMQQRASQEALARQDELRKQAPALAKQLNLNEADLAVLSPEQIQKMRIDQLTRDPRDNQLMDLKLQEEQLKIDALRNPRAGTPQMVDLPGGGKGWATPGSADVLPIGGAGKGALDPATVKRSDNEDMNLTYATEAITANRVLSDPAYSGELTSGYKKRVNMIPALEGSWAGEKYLTGDSQANSFIDSVVRPRSGAVIGANEEAAKKRIFTPMPGDTQEQLFEKAKMRSQHIQSLIAGANPADRPMLQQMFEDSQQELLGLVPGSQNSQPELPPGVSIRRVN